MKRVPLFSLILFLVTILFCDPVSLIASNKAGNLLKPRNETPGFIENKGQIIDQKNNPNPAVLYLLNTPGMNVQLRKEGFSYDLYRISNIDQRSLKYEGTDQQRHPESLYEKRAANIQYHQIDISLEGANHSCQIIPSDPLTEYFNYFTSNCPPEGIKNVRQYSQITYKDIYPDIDLVFFTTGEHGYEYNFVIRPGGNIDDIKLSIAGPEDISLIQDTLKFGTRFGEVEELIPESYYLVNDSRVDVQARFKRIDNEVYGFAIHKAIPENSLLVIDPTAIRLWGTYYGGSSTEASGQCAIDKAGNVFLTGTTQSTNNIANSGSYQQNLIGNQNAFLAKFNAAGQRKWGTYFGGGSEQLNYGSIAVDKSGNIYFAGTTTSTSGIASPGAHQTVYGGGQSDCFLEKFDQSGNRLWGTYYGGANTDAFGNVCTDKNGNVFLTGETASDTGISTPGSYQPNIYNSNPDAFLAKFDSNGVRQWGTYYGGEGTDISYASTTDSSGNVFFCGETSSNTNIASPGAYQTVYGGGVTDAFLAKFTTGGQRIWATYYGGLNEDEGYGCDADSAENVCLVGRTNSTNGIASPGCFQPVFGGGFYDAFIVKFDSLGQRQWGTYYGGTNWDDGNNCTFGSGNDIFMAGWTASTNNISTPDSYQPTLAGFDNGFLVKFNATGQCLWGTYYGGSDVDNFGNCSYVKDDTIYMAGSTGSTNNIASPGAWQTVYGGTSDDMLIKFLDCWSIDTTGPIVGPINVCKPSTGVSYSIPPIAHAVNYIWLLPAGFTLTNGAGTPSIAVDITNTAISGYIVVQALNKCDSGASAYLYVTVGQAPVPVISGTNNTCEVPGMVYSTAAGETNYQWSVSAGGVITSGGTTTDNTVTVTWNAAGTQHVYVNYTDANGCSAESPTDYVVTVTSSPAVSITITTATNNVCSGTQVTFNSTSSNGGGNPAYQWQVNGINAGTNNPTYSYIPVNGDLVTCVLTSNAACASGNPATSNTVTMTVNPNLPVSVSITASQNPVCAGNSVIFSATPTYGGLSPSYQWKVNGVNVGTDSPAYSYIPTNGDLVSCILTSSATCTTNNPASSIQYPVSVIPNLAVSISISASANPFCQGSSVTFTGTPVNGSPTPSFQWQVNGINVGTNSPTYTYNPANGDLVLCILTSGAQCTTGNPATSNTIMMIVNSILPAGVTIVASSNPFCPGSSVTFSATPINGGTTPAYQWKVNGINAGTNSSAFTYNPANGDSVRCLMTSNLTCVTNNPASSAEIIMSGTLAPIVTFTSCFDTITTVNAKPIKLKGGIPLGGIYSGTGVNSLTGIFTPATAGVGTKTITYTYTNAAMCSASKSIHIIVQSALAFTCGNNITDIRDNKAYPTVQLGSQCWLAANLNFGTIIASTQDQRDNCVFEKYCYNDNPVNCTNQGGLYQWDELMQYDATPGDQGFCPPDWHIPTENDWNTLFANYVNNGFAGSPLKYSGYSGFNALLSGSRHIDKSWDFQGFATFFWSSSSYGGDKAWGHGMNDPDPSVSIYPGSGANAFAVRCLKD